MSKSTKFLQIFLFIASSLACIGQIIMVTNDYLKYDVTTEIQISFPDALEIPDVSICLNYVNFINYTALTEKQPAISNRMQTQFPEVADADTFSEWKFSAIAKDFLIRELSSLTVAQLMAVLIQSEELIKGIYPIKLQKEIIRDMSINREDACTYETYLKEPTICIVICCGELASHKLRLQDLVLNSLSGSDRSINSLLKNIESN